MWRNYLTVGLRALTKNRAYAFINIFGLALGIAACLLILLYVRYERSYDSALPDADRTYQLQVSFQSKTTSDNFLDQGAPYVSKAALLKDFPQIQSAAYIGGGVSITVLDKGRAYSPDDAVLADSSFFDTVSLPFVRGAASGVSRPGTAALSEREATRIFGTTDVIGRTITAIILGNRVDYRIGGVFRDLPRNSHIALNLVLRADFPSLYTRDDLRQFLTSWGWTSGWVYVKLRPGTDVAAINGQMEAWEKRNIPDEVNEGRRSNPGDERIFRLVAVQDVHLGPAQGSAMTPGNDASSIITFAVVAILILAMACMNFTNLATARASQRAREVALRKALGATRGQLVTQFLGESILIAALATLLALALMEIALPWFSAFLGADLKMRYFGAGGLALPILLLVLLVGGAGGLYPALYLSRFQPARVLKANKSASDAEGSGRLRSILVVVQFAVSIGLIVCTAVVYGQSLHARSVDPGFQRKGLLQVAGIGATALKGREEALLQQVARLPGVRGVGRSGIAANTGMTSTTTVRVVGRSEPTDIGSYGVDDGYFATIGLPTLAGRVFQRGRPADDMTTPSPEDPAAERALAQRGANVVINQAGVKRLGFASAHEAVGKVLRYGVKEEYGGTMPVTIIGVVGDARFRDARKPLEPILFVQETNQANYMLVRAQGNPRQVRQAVEGVWRSFAPEVPFTADYADEVMARTWKQIDARAQMFGIFATLAVVIGCLGLFGLAAFTAERRTKEIGIRKVLGARTRDVVRLLVWQFTRPVLIANLLAWPFAWWLMRDWLNQFDARMPLTPAPFLFGGLLALLIAVTTIASHAIRVARANPIRSLRYE